MAKLVLLRHGKSLWNEKNLFTGTIDISLSGKGIQESFLAGKALSSISIDIIFVSALIRSQMTALLAMSKHPTLKAPQIFYNHDCENISFSSCQKDQIPVYVSPQLNERHYGQLQGFNKQEMIQHYGEAQIQKWRRGYTDIPPSGESLKMTAERVIPYFETHIVPYLIHHQNVLICAHGNSLRSIIMYLNRLSPEEIQQIEIETGSFLIYNFCKKEWKQDG